MTGPSGPELGAMPPVQWLRTFLVVAHAGSFSEASLRLHMTQAAVSRHVRLLEHRLGAALFERHARGVVPTPLAVTMLPRVSEAFALLEAASAEVTEQPRVHLHCDITWAEAVLSRRLHELGTRHPDIRLQVSTFVWPEANPASDADLHVLIGVGELPPLRRVELAGETAHVVASPRLAREFAEHPERVVCLSGIGQESAWRRWTVHHGERPVGAARLICDSSIVTRAAALAGQGLTMLRESQYRADLAAGTLVRVDDFVEHLEERYALYRREPTAQSEPVRRIADWLVEIGTRGV